jgi:hypothetical protein
VPTGKSGEWPNNGVYVCEEDDRCMDVGRLYGVNLDRLVQINKVRYKGLNKTCKVGDVGCRVSGFMGTLRRFERDVQGGKCRVWGSGFYGYVAMV